MATRDFNTWVPSKLVQYCRYLRAAGVTWITEMLKIPSKATSVMGGLRSALVSGCMGWERRGSRRAVRTVCRCRHHRSKTRRQNSYAYAAEATSHWFAESRTIQAPAHEHPNLATTTWPSKLGTWHFRQPRETQKRSLGMNGGKRMLQMVECEFWKSRAKLVEIH